MKKRILVLFCIVLFSNHDLYIKMNSYFLESNTNAQLQLFNGTFDESEGLVVRDRMLDASFVINNNRLKIEAEQWKDVNSTKTVLEFTTGEEGTWVAGVSSKPRNIELAADKFNNYLEHDGVLDMLEERKQQNLLDSSAVEKYSKYVKAIFQVGEKKTDDWSVVLGYPIEFVPQENPYSKNTGDSLKVQLLRDGKPLANQLVFTDFRPTKHGHSHSHSHDENNSHDNSTHSHNPDGSHKDDEEDHTHTTGQQIRTDANGMATVHLTNDGIWYIRTIHMVNSSEEGLTHESNWSTLTFEVTHAHEHSHEEGIPSYLFWIASIVVIGGLFFFFNRKK